MSLNKNKKIMLYVLNLSILFLVIIIKIIGLINSGENIIGPQDTFAPATGALEILKGKGYNYNYLSSIGTSLMLTPFFIFLKNFLSIKIALIFYSSLLVLLSYIFIRLIYLKSKFPSIIGAILIILNPILSVYSFIAFYDIILLCILLLFIIFLIKLTENNNNLFRAVYFNLGLLLSLLKESNITFIFFSGIFLFIFPVKHHKPNFNKNKIKNLLTFILLLSIILLINFSNADTRYRFEKDTPTFFLQNKNIHENIRSTINALSNPINTPNYAGVFRSTRIEKKTIDILETLTLLFIMIFSLLIIFKKNFKTFFLIFGVGIVNFLIFTLFIKWQLRYYFPLLISLLFLISISIYIFIKEFRYSKIVKYIFLVLLIIILSNSLSNNINGLSNLNKKESRIQNYVLLNNKDMKQALELIPKNNSIIYSSYGPWVNFYLLEKNKKLMFVDLYKIVYYSTSIKEASKKINKQIKGNLSKGINIFYISGWQEHFIENKDYTRNYHIIWSNINQEFDVKIIFYGDNKICNIILKHDCFRLNTINLKNETTK